MAAESDGLNKSRVESLTEGVFATAMTILVLNLVVPVVTGPNVSSDLASDLLALWPNFLIYAISFITLGVIWIAHNQRFMYIHKINGKLIWVNIIFLLSVGILPFTTALIGKYPLQELTVVLYGINLFAISLSMNFFTLHAMNDHLIDLDGHSKSIHNTRKRNLVSLVLYPLAVLCAFINIEMSLILFIVVPVFYIASGTLFGY